MAVIETHELEQGKLEFLKDKKFRWRITGNNGEIIESSNQGFDSLRLCKNNLQLVSDILVDYLKLVVPFKVADLK